MFFKEHKTGRVVVVSSLDEAHWKAVSQKLGLSLAPHFASNAFELLDPSRFLGSSPDTQGTLRRLYDEIHQRIPRTADASRSSTPRLLVIDDISILEWISTEPTTIIRFIRAIRHITASSGTGVVIRYHSTSPTKPPPVLQHLMETCHYHVSVKSLTSGRSGAVSGEATINAGPVVEDKGFVSRPTAEALHYRVDASGFKFFDRGTAGGVI
ncbi:hypothetical protein M407DRAFT_245068 [Tulasnella calospora MUT 4182]|uniref:Elongator complex protein 5 n=1 Tax=Tulasnella calospora MUT 4182 TaxID=1051891 RepID=A0A0C3Q2I3_9AGAM|nr:hypothetical protein M407DRAFT_245068 [Tulasnella calospora MUT 4182]